MFAYKLHPQNLANARRGIVLIVVATLAFASVGRALADPVPSQSNIPVFCFRITDIQRVAGDPGNDKFRFEFEVLNWSNGEAFGVYIALDEGTSAVSGSAPFFAGADIDADGRPLVLLDVNGDGTINDADLEDANGNGLLDPGEDINGNGRLDNDPIPGNVNPPNDWTVASSTATAISWSAGTTVPGIDLIGFASGIPLQPGDPEISFMDFTNLSDPNSVVIETIDNGPNVMDGFVITVDDFDPGEILSFNWFLTDINGIPIGDPSGEGGGNPYGFGVVNLTSLSGSTFPGPVFSGNTGFSQSPKLFFDSVYHIPNPANFAAEFGAALTATFQNPADNLFNIPITTQLLNPLIIDFDRDATGNPIPDRTLIGEQYAAWGVHITPVYFTGSRLTCYPGYTSGTSPNYLVTFTAAEADPVNCRAPTLGRNEVLTVSLDFPASSASIEGYTRIDDVDGDRLRMQAFDAAGNLVDENQVLCSNTPNPNPPPQFTEGICKPTVSGSGIRTLKVFPRADLIDALDNLVIAIEVIQKPKLIVVKHVINDNGGTAVASDFTMSVTGTNVSPASFPGAEASGTTIMLDAGDYSVGETGPSGYAMSLSADCTGTIAVGETKTCTVTNDDIQPTLIVVKHVINDNGGTAVAADFTMNVTGVNVNPSSFPGSELPGTTLLLDAGSYSVSESGPNGYTASFSADCTGTIAVGETKTCTVTNDDTASFSADCTGTIAVGETKTCTVTNDDIQPTLIVVKHVINDNGGTAVAADFTMSVTGTNVNPPSFPGAESPGTMVALDVGNYNVTESGPSGYTASFSVDCTGTIAIGETKTCTVTNDDIESPPDLVIEKSDGHDTARAGETLTYTLAISNVGAQAATGVIVADTLPTLTRFVAASDGGTASGRLVTWPVFDLAAGASVTRTVTVKVTDMLPGGSSTARIRDTRTWEDPRGSGLRITFSTPEHYSGCRPPATITNAATVADDGAHGPDPTPENNTASDTDRVIASDVIWTTGIPNNWSLVGWVRVEYVTDTGRILIKQYRVRQTGNLRLTVTYPPVSEWPVMRNGIAEIHVDLSIGVFDNNGRPVRWVGGDQRRAPGTLGPGQDWDVWCRVANR
ncbi:MAG: DUF11 domain-containing protein [Chloroflexi bacterium]|nr:DUF11 domain-containing protein [Chloroflexota bacterium]